jgi:hypothetical protein
MVISFERLGPIQQGKIELGNSLTVFTGPNQTGKTWASYCIYALYNRSFFNIRHPDILIACRHFLFSGIAELDVLEWWKSHNKTLCAQLAKQLKNNLTLLFALPASYFEQTDINLVAGEEDGSRVQWLPKYDWLRVFEREYRIQLEKAARSSIIRLRLVDSKAPLQDMDTAMQERLLQFLQDQLSECILRILFSDAYYAPAERAAVYLFMNELSLLNRNFTLETRKLRKAQRDLPVYTLPIADSLSLVDFAASAEPGPCFALGRILEKEILQGELSYKQEGVVYFTPFDSPKSRIPLLATAGGIQQMAGVIWLLKYIIQPGDFLLIDSPELMLHSEKQRLLARCLARIVNAGIRLLMITHSLAILQELTQLALPAEPGTDLYQVRKTEFLKSKEILPDMILNASCIRSYLFRSGTICSLPMGPSGPLDMVGYNSTIL